MARKLPFSLAPSRRGFLRGMAAAGGLAATGGLAGLSRSARGDGGPCFLVTFGCFGGASMLDCFMPVDQSQALTVDGRGTVISYDTLQPDGSNIRAVNRGTPQGFLSYYRDQMVVTGYSASSVNHFTAQARSVNGRGIFAGRTLGEAVAAVHGADMPLPNVNMGRGGYALPGADPTLDVRFRPEIVTNPVTFPLSTSGWKGVIEGADGSGPFGADGLAIQDPEMLGMMVEHARAVREGTLEQTGPFGRTFGSARRRQELLYARGDAGERLELDDLIQQLFFVPDLGEVLPLNRYGLQPSDQVNRVLAYLPSAFPTDTSGTPRDRLQAQAALAYMLLVSGASASVTLTDPGTDGFLAFDNSHTNHRSAQEQHWDRVLDVAHRLIQLLQLTEYGDSGGSMWDRTMMVFATEFGRDKWDTGGSFGTGHHLNNGLLLVSPLLAGNQSLGAPDPNNGFISGYDPVSGEALAFDDIPAGEDPLFTDERLPPGEEPVFGSILAAMGISYDGQETIPVMLDGPA